MKYKKLFVTFFIICSACQLLSGQNFILELYDKAELLYEAPTQTSDSLALLNYSKIISTFMPDDDRGKYILYDSYIKAGSLEQTLGSPKLALHLYKKGISASQAFDLADSTLFHPYLFMGMAYYALQKIDSSLIYLEKAENVLKKNVHISKKDGLYNSLGAIYYQSGNYAQSINYFRKAILSTPFIADYSSYQINAFRANIASGLRGLHQYDSAIQIYKSMLAEGFEADFMYINLGISYVGKGQGDSALFFLNKVKSRNANFYNNMVMAYLINGNYVEAEKGIKKALSFTENEISGTPLKGTSYKLLGDLNQSLGKINEALVNYQKSLNQLAYNFRDTSIFSNPKNVSSLNRYAIFETLRAKAVAFDEAYRLGEDKKMFQGAFNAYDAAIKISDYVAKYFDNDEARLFHASEVLPTYEKAVSLLVFANERVKKKDYLEKAFLWAEKSKSSTLLVSLKEDQLKTKSQLPDSLVKAEYNLKYQLSRLSIQINNMDNQDTIQKIIRKER